MDYKVGSAPRIEYGDPHRVKGRSVITRLYSGSGTAGMRVPIPEAWRQSLPSPTNRPSLLQLTETAIVLTLVAPHLLEQFKS